jgi:ATP-binding cassette, subfamily C, bacteriocin exporter
LKVYQIKRQGDSMFHRRYYCVKHNDWAMSGAACLATVAKQYGLKVSALRLREASFTDENGASTLGLMKAAPKLNLSAKGVKYQPGDQISDIPFPAIARIIKDNRFIYIVIHTIDQKGFLIANPQEGIKYYQTDYFYQVWTGRLLLLTPTEQFARGNQESGSLKRFLFMIYSQKKLLVEIMIASAILTCLGIASTYYFKYFVDTILPNGLKNTLIIVSCGYLLIKLFSDILSVFRSYLLLYFSQKIDIMMILQYFQHVLELPMNFFSSHKTGDILQRSNDARQIRQALSTSTMSIILDSSMVFIGGLLVFFQNATLFGTVLITLPIYFAIVWLFKGLFQKLNHTISEKSSEMQSYLVEAISGISIIKANNGETLTHWETEKRYMSVNKAIFKAEWMGNIQLFLKSILGDINNLLIWWIGGLQFIKGEITLGQLMTFNALLSYFIGPLQNLINLQSTIQQASVATERFIEIMDIETEKENESNKIQLGKIKGDIEFKNVYFRYGVGKLVLENINFKITAGEKVALVGATGCGKTTLAKLLLRFYPPEKGKILIDGINIQNISLESLRERIGYVPQESFLFGGTIKENLAFGSPDATLEEIIETAKKTHIHNFIEELPLMYNTVITERGGSLSVGQKQRISIARAILKKPNLLILDEATSNLDTITEQAIHNTIESICEGITTIIIAHRLSTIVNCQKIIVFENGQIIESGTHQELLLQKGKYYGLWQAQFVGNGKAKNIKSGEEVS